jgi:polyisoprenoid-binding protein YceI
MQYQHLKISGFARSTLFSLAATLLIGASGLRAGDTIRFEGKPGSKVRISGTSTIHDWVMDGKIIIGYFEVPVGVSFDQSQATLPGTTGGKFNAHAEVSIPVRSMKSEHQGMDEAMQDAMNEKEHPRIRYQLTEITLKQPHAPGAPFQFDTRGDLSLNGVTNKITMPVTIESTDKSHLKISGEVPLKMTDFKIKPPVKAGIFRTADDVKISFEWIAVAPEKTADAK